VIGADTSVLVRYLVGTPPAQARRAARLVDGEEQIGVSVVALAECAHVLRTQYGIAPRDILDSLIGLVQRENIRVTDARLDVLVAMLVRARALPGRPIPDALIVGAALAADAVPLATFDTEQRRFGIATREP
jgi:predicted nucleic acid-binding protein